MVNTSTIYIKNHQKLLIMLWVDSKNNSLKITSVWWLWQELKDQMWTILK